MVNDGVRVQMDRLHCINGVTTIKQEGEYRKIDSAGKASSIKIHKLKTIGYA
jgi:hypothetical protein